MATKTSEERHAELFRHLSGTPGIFFFGKGPKINCQSVCVGITSEHLLNTNDANLTVKEKT